MKDHREEICPRTKTGKHHFRAFVKSNGKGGLIMFTRCIRCGFSHSDNTEASGPDAKVGFAEPDGCKDSEATL